MDDIIICRCEEVSLGSIQLTMRDGACSAKEIKLRTRAGMGICQGRTCRPLIEQIIQDLAVEVPYEVRHLSQRFPIRPLLLSDLVNNSQKGDKR